MAWSQLEPSPPHVTYTVLAGFLVLYALFASFVRNNLHLSEPPLATLVGIAFGPKGLNVLTPEQWGMNDPFVQEYTRIILGIQCFAVGLELPKNWFSKKVNIRSLLMLLGPVMAGGWLVCTLFIHLLFNVDIAMAFVIAACLTPTDPVLAASILSGSQFSSRIPRRLRFILSAESGCNDGISFPFLYVGLSILTRSTAGGAVKKWFLITVLYQCTLGVVIGSVIGFIANRLLRFSESRKMTNRAAFVTFYLLLSIFSIGVASTLGVDDFLVAFSAGATFSRDGWFAKATEESSLSSIVDMLLNSSLFVYFGASIPWSAFTQHFDDADLHVTVPKLFALLALVLVFRRIPFMLLLKPIIPGIKTYREALFAGHFGPMGVGALFLAMEARAQLETDTSEPLPKPPQDGSLPGINERGALVVWPIICFIVLGSTFVHGVSTFFISIGVSLNKPQGERAPLLGAETDGLGGMVFSDEEQEDEQDEG